ncbi:MAG: 30S ribosomal protein S17 [Candidatus Altiarchaeales archaeon IMC4]|nr:ribosomal protein S17 [uncultured archaeon]ODS42740.1 MAG: 30S ribosomal protein S17 [Candidatus Altiarchaeales archaeon IMC4]
MVKKEEKAKEVECTDANCPVHGTLSTRGVVLEGTVKSDKMQGTAIVERNYVVSSKKYERSKRSRSNIPAHNPPCISAKPGDKVRIMECRKLSKTVSFVITDKLE